MLEILDSIDFDVSVGVWGVPKPLYHVLKTKPEVLQLREAYLKGEITDIQIRQFVNNLLKDFKTGFQFEHNMAVMAIAVALENIDTPFAKEYIKDLAALEISEMIMPRYVARLCQEAAVPKS